MNKNDFLNLMQDYIESLKNSDLEYDDMIRWIRFDCRQQHMELSDMEIEWIATEALGL